MFLSRISINGYKNELSPAREGVVGARAPPVPSFSGLARVSAFSSSLWSSFHLSSSSDAIASCPDHMLPHLKRSSTWTAFGFGVF